MNRPRITRRPQNAVGTAPDAGKSSAPMEVVEDQHEMTEGLLSALRRLLDDVIR